MYGHTPVKAEGILFYTTKTETFGRSMKSSISAMTNPPMLKYLIQDTPKSFTGTITDKNVMKQPTLRVWSMGSIPSGTKMGKLKVKSATVTENLMEILQVITKMVRLR